MTGSEDPGLQIDSLLMEADGLNRELSELRGMQSEQRAALEQTLRQMRAREDRVERIRIEVRRLQDRLRPAAKSAAE